MEKKEDSERIKALSTGDVAKIERKNIDKTETPFFGKFILCSNNEKNFIKIDQSEIRYWVRKISVPDNENTELLEELITEIPAFLFYLTERGIKSKKISRMWFSADAIATQALAKLKSGNKSSLERELETIIPEKIDDFEVEEIKMTLGDLYDELKHMRVSKEYIKQVLKEKLKLKPRDNPSTYKLYHWVNDPGTAEKLRMIPGSTDQQGRYYTFTRQLFEIKKLDNTKKIEGAKMSVSKCKVI